MATSRQVRTLRKKLVEVAKSGGTVAYSAIDRIVGLNVSSTPADRPKFGAILAELGEDEVLKGRPFLPAVVVRKWSKRPGPGFYPMARKLCGRKYHRSPNTAVHDGVLQEVHRYWRRA